jgi:GNAT superfamily N-acetyltransferase
MTFDYRIRCATVADAAVIARHRAAMFYDLQSVNEIESASIISASIPQLSEMLAKGDYLGWLVELDEKVVASGGVMLRRLLPRPGSLEGGEEAYIPNVYTEPEYRRRGLARIIMETILTWCFKRGVARVTLHPSDEGEPLYRSLGFESTKEMLWVRMESKKISA